MHSRISVSTHIQANTILQGKPKHSTSKPAKSFRAEVGDAKRASQRTNVLVHDMAQERELRPAAVKAQTHESRTM